MFQYGPRYEWSAYDQGLVLGSYSWGTVIVTFVAGVLAEKYGPRIVIGSAIMSGAILTALTPIAAKFLWLSIMIRLLTGIAMVRFSVFQNFRNRLQPFTGCNLSVHTSGDC